MLYAGTQITSSSDQLKKVSLDYLYHSIKNPKPDITAKIRQLRIIRDIDRKRYGMLKKELPYLVCGAFNPPYRRTENFAFIEYFIIDIDHISQKRLSIKDVRNCIEKDARVVMCFLSPGEDGLKVVFHLKERCYDHGMFSLFYKVFARQFSETYHLEQVLDTQTNDVTRACFISCDPDVFYNANADPVDMNGYIDEKNPLSLFDLKRKMEKQEAKSQETVQQQEPAEQPEHEKDPDDESIQKIKEILKLKKPQVEKPPVYVPEQLNEIMDGLKKYIEETGIQLTEVINISYGKKLRMKLGMKQAEINLFYGKRGYSVVESPRCGTNAELNNLAAGIINNFLME